MSGLLRSVFLEEQVAVVLDVGLEVELVHETAGSLHGLLLELSLLLLVVLLSTFALLLGEYLEDICCSVTLNDISTELTFLGSGNSTTQRGL